MHGSLNWLMESRNPQHLYSFDSLKSQPEYPDVEGLIKGGYVSAIVPPFSEKISALEKEPLAGKIARTWTVALDCLLRAKKWIFIGYSLPPTDVASRWLFLNALAFHRKKNDDSPKVQIVDPKAFQAEKSRKSKCEDYKDKDGHNLLKLLKSMNYDLQINCCLRNINEGKCQCEEV